MARIDDAGKEIHCKIVYWGPSMSGKITNMEFLHRDLPSPGKGELTSIPVEGDRTLYLDFSLPEQERISGFQVRYGFYGLPGSIGGSTSSRRGLLQGADGAIFVADSGRGKMEENKESIDDLARLLEEQGRSMEEFPVLMQWNKRDLADVVPVTELEEKLNPWNFHSLEAVASRGEWVLETARSICDLVYRRLEEKGIRNL